MSIFDPQFNGIPAGTMYRGWVDPDLAGGNTRPACLKNWPKEEVLIFDRRAYEEMYGYLKKYERE